MTEPLPKWLMKRYSMLWRDTRGSPFTHEDAQAILRLSEGLTSAVLSELRKAGWLSAEMDPNDTRKRIYTIIGPEDAVKAMRHS
jgi:hypothetical protein